MAAILPIIMTIGNMLVTWKPTGPLLFAPQLDKALDKLTIRTAYKSMAARGGSTNASIIFLHKQLSFSGSVQTPGLADSSGVVSVGGRTAIA